MSKLHSDLSSLKRDWTRSRYITLATSKLLQEVCQFYQEHCDDQVLSAQIPQDLSPRGYVPQEYRNQVIALITAMLNNDNTNTEEFYTKYRINKHQSLDDFLREDGFISKELEQFISQVVQNMPNPAHYRVGISALQAPRCIVISCKMDAAEFRQHLVAAAQERNWNLEPFIEVSNSYAKTSI